MLDAIIMADMHCGAINPDRFMKELDSCLFTRLNHMKKLDAFIIAGDLFDMKEYSSSDTFRMVLELLQKILEYTEKLDTKIVVLKGTRTHDDLQLYTLETIYKDCERIKFIHTVETDEICGVSFLYVPEEYVIDQELYYREYFASHYDIMIGHGMIDKIWYAKDNTRKGISSAPIFNVEDLCKTANYCYFGHIHEHRAYGKSKRFKYVGPMTVWEYDKKDCGYYIIHYDETSNLANEEYVPNEYAQVLKTCPISVADTMTMEELVDKIQTVLDHKDYDGMKLIVRLNPSVPIYVQAKNYLVTKIGLYDKVTLSIVSDEVEETKEEVAVREKTEELHEALFTNTLDDDAAIAEFIRNKEGKHISLNRIREVCAII